MTGLVYTERYGGGYKRGRGYRPSFVVRRVHLDDCRTLTCNTDVRPAPESFEGWVGVRYCKVCQPEKPSTGLDTQAR